MSGVETGGRTEVDHAPTLHHNMVGKTVMKNYLKAESVSSAIVPCTANGWSFLNGVHAVCHVIVE